LKNYLRCRYGFKNRFKMLIYYTKINGGHFIRNRIIQTFMGFESIVEVGANPTKAPKAT